MFKKFNFIFFVVLAFVSINVSAQTVRFNVKTDASVVKNEPLSGRLLIFMTADPTPRETLGPNFMNPEAVYITGVEIANLDAGKTIEVDPDLLAFPRKFSEARAGEYQIMALLDRDHSYTYDGMGEGDVYSSIVKAKMPGDSIDLTLSKTLPPAFAPFIENAKVVEFESPMLSAFWGRPIKMRATVVLPPGYDKSTSQKFPTVYGIHGYGGDHFNRGIPNLIKAMTDGRQPEMIYVYLNAQCSLGHHVFADSANNGPWGTALVKEFIPHLEKQFRMDGRPSGRFLTGHSSGGWSTLWVMITHPDFFGGTWSTSPDPVDFRNFTGPDLTNPAQNAFTNLSGKEFNLVRFQGKEIMTFREYAQQERVLGYFGGQFASFDAVFSPKGADGQPMPLFHRDTGRIDRFVAKAWEKYDISLILRNNWTTLGPKLKGKLHIIVGTVDNFHLDESLRLLEAELKKLGSDAKIEYIEGRDHFDLYKDGLSARIANEMYAVARPKVKAAK